MGSGSLSTGRKPWECQNSSQGCVWVSVCKLTSACVQKCLCVQWLSFCLAPQSPDDINCTQGKLRGCIVGLMREQQAAIIKTALSQVKVNATSVVTMLEYNWYGQVSETDTPTPAVRCLQVK